MSAGTKKRDGNELIAERRRKLTELRESGNPYPNDFRRNALADELHQSYGKHEDEHLREEAVRVSVAGRMMIKRVMGKASFIKLQDRTGQIQVRLERDREMAAQALNDVGPHRDVGHEYAVHHIPMDAITARLLQLDALLAQSGEVGGEYGRRDLDGALIERRGTGCRAVGHVATLPALIGADGR